MELHSHPPPPPPAVGRKLWNILRIAFFMMRKGFVSKRKLIMDMNLMMQRGKVLGKSLGKNLMFHPHASSSTMQSRQYSFGLHEYEFSCNNSPNPIFFRLNSKRKHSYFPCMGATAVDDDKAPAPPPPVIVLPRIEYSPKSTSDTSDKCTPIPSPMSVRVSNYSVAEEGEGLMIDDQAEEFIKRFHQQLQGQGQIALLQYQEEQYQEMIARGT